MAASTEERVKPHTCSLLFGWWAVGAVDWHKTEWMKALAIYLLAVSKSAVPLGSWGEFFSLSCNLAVSSRIEKKNSFTMGRLSCTFLTAWIYFTIFTPERGKTQILRLLFCTYKLCVSYRMFQCERWQGNNSDQKQPFSEMKCRTRRVRSMVDVLSTFWRFSWAVILFWLIPGLEHNVTKTTGN